VRDHVGVEATQIRIVVVEAAGHGRAV
jgi:hypothetical protein